MIQDTSVVSLSEGVSYQALGDGEGAVVLIIESGQLFTCNDTTSAFLAAANGERSFGEVVKSLLDTFEVSEDELRTDLAQLVRRLQQQGIVRVQ